jgi:DNA-binding transcriptional ArsR family regulator
VDVFTALADPTRRRVLDLLADGDCTAGELVAAFPHLTQPAVSRHLRLLREAQLVHSHPDGQRRVYAIDPHGLVTVDAWLRRYRSFWADRLDRLDMHLAQMQRGKDRSNDS